MTVEREFKGMDQSSSNSSDLHYISGWLTDTFNAQVKPDYGCPRNKLPAVRKGYSMRVDVGFISPGN